MRLKTVYIRFYKSFNYDTLRKLDLDSTPDKINPMPWEFINGMHFPHISIQIDSQITTVVGANESGKSYLLSSIEKCRYGNEEKYQIERKDFCRYSQFFDSVEQNIPRYPDFGFEWIGLESEEQEELKQICFPELKKKKAAKNEVIADNQNNNTETIGLDFSRFYFFRNKDSYIFYVPKCIQPTQNVEKNKEAVSDDSGEVVALTNEERAKLNVQEFEVKNFREEFLPTVFTIDSKIALPDSVLISDLLRGRKKENDDYNSSKYFNVIKAFGDIEEIQQFINQIANSAVVNENTNSINKSLVEQAKKYGDSIKSQTSTLKDDERIAEIKSFNLAYDLIFEIAKIQKEDLQLLLSESSGVVKSIEKNINAALASNLRFPRVWSQDKNFALKVDATEIKLNFIITDRTDCEYSFDERSGGMRHFLSYYIQYLTHKTPNEVTSEILLMDEPDAYLSGEAQQDLLKIFQMFADPNAPGSREDKKPVQVVYVTHSPFLIDKNHSERVRAVEKPEGRKGTQVIVGPTQNRYEPLRSAFGAFTGETVFMSHCNLMVEGTADQILIAGANNYLRASGAKIPEFEMLDLNKITIVPCGGASNVPYMTYLATGRGTEKPAVIVLLDSDSPGDKAKEALIKEPPNEDLSIILEEAFILQLGEISRDELSYKDVEQSEFPFVDSEDLVPLSLALRVTKNFLKTYFGVSDDLLNNLTENAVKTKKAEINKSNFSVIKALVADLDTNKTYSIDKVPFAKTLVEMLPDLFKKKDADELLKNELTHFEGNIRALSKRLREMQAKAEQSIKEANQRKKVKDHVDTFFIDYKSQGRVSCERVSFLLNLIEGDLEGSPEEKREIKERTGEIRTNHRLNDDPLADVVDFEKLLSDLEQLKNVKEIVRRRKIQSI